MILKLAGRLPGRQTLPKWTILATPSSWEADYGRPRSGGFSVDTSQMHFAPIPQTPESKVYPPLFEQAVLQRFSAVRIASAHISPMTDFGATSAGTPMPALLAVHSSTPTTSICTASDAVLVPEPKTSANKSDLNMRASS
ncbi:hypothetical protein GCM10011521_22270 [Arenimonas soli]|uniref:Uncharacterized protein n=1 Tax=Arenimonas soli TaxID=2269504 RepID=A0ABQ1HNP1_9GAMM|nr:hypothetical protein GCM10011521_22270 [Arenimonas soli]